MQKTSSARACGVEQRVWTRREGVDWCGRSVDRDRVNKKAKSLHTMETVDLSGASVSLYSPGTLALFKVLPAPASASAPVSASASLRLLGLRGPHRIDREAVLAAIDGPPTCPLLELKDLPPTHYVRKANGGRECVGVFVNKEVCEYRVPVTG